MYYVGSYLDGNVLDALLWAFQIYQDIIIYLVDGIMGAFMVNEALSISVSLTLFSFVYTKLHVTLLYKLNGIMPTNYMIVTIY